MFQNGLYQLIFFVTSRCNANCAHCFNRANLNNKSADLSLEKIGELAKALPPIKNFLLSGGEPFLRNDLAELINIFKANNDIQTVSIPTNGFFTEKIIDSMLKVLKIPGLKSVNVNISLDGLKETHDKMRGLDGNFEAALKTFCALSRLKKDHPNLNILVNSVISRENFSELLKLGKYLAKENVPFNHFFEIIRPPLINSSVAGENFFEFKKSFYDKILAWQYDYFKKSLPPKRILKNFLSKVVFLGRYSLIYGIQRANFRNKKPWPFPCQAGRNILVLNSDGRIRPCELRGKSFDLAESFRGRKLAAGSGLAEEIKAIKGGRQCFCTHVCFIDSSLNESFWAKYVLTLIFGLKNFVEYEYFNHHSNL